MQNIENNKANPIKAIALIGLSLLSLSGIAAQDGLIRYGAIGATDSGQVARDTGVGGLDSDISFSGYTLNNGVTTAVGDTAGNLYGGIAGASLVDPVSGLTMTVDAITGGSTLISTGIGSTLSIAGGDNKLIDLNESVAFTFDSDVSFKYLRVFQAGSRGVAGTVGKITIGSQETTFTVGASVLYVDLGNAVLAAGEQLSLSTVSGGGWSVNGLLVSTVPAGPASTIGLTNEAGDDVSAQTLVDSDVVALQIADPASVVSYQYKYLLQTSEPTQAEWDAEVVRPFNKGMTFYREPSNQWVYVEVELNDNSVLSSVFGVKGGVLTSPPDDPIAPADYVALMGTGFDVTWSKAIGKVNLIEADIVMIQAAGFKNIRLRENNGLYDETTGWDNTYSDHLDWQIDMLLRHNLIPILAFSTHQVLIDYQAWWGPVTEYYKNKSHRLSFNLMVEIGNVGPLTDPIELNSWYETITADIRENTTTHNVIYAPNGFSHVDGLVNLVIPAQAGQYAFAEWHVWAGGPSNAFAGKDWTTGTVDEKAYIDSVVDKAVDWSAQNGFPTWLGAWMPGDYLNFDLLTYPEQIGFSDYLLTRLEAEGIPSSINALPTWFMDAVGHHWHEERLPIIEILNRDGSVDINDRDGDGLSNDDEVNVYGTDPDHADTDRDNIVDGNELQYGFNPLSDIDGDPDHNDATAADFDNDGMNDAVEIHYGFDPTNAADGLEDDDFDGLTNAGELIAKVAPYKFVSRTTMKMNLRDELSDLDNDGWGAANEIAVGRNPRDRWGNPSLEIFQWRPTVEDDNVTVGWNQTTAIDVLANDTDVEDDTLTVLEVTEDSRFFGREWQTKEGGVATINADNTIAYTPATDFLGMDEFQYIVTDGFGYTLGVATIEVTEQGAPPPPPSGDLILTVNGYKTKGKQKADLSWSGGVGSDVDVIRDGAKIATTANDGSYTDNINNRGGGSYTYQVCEAGTSTCSGFVTVSF